MDFTEINMFYAAMYQAMGLLFIWSAFLLWLAMRVTSVLVERKTDNIVAKALAIVFGAAASLNFVGVTAQMSYLTLQHGFGLKMAAANGETSPTAEAFVSSLNLGDTVPEMSLMGNPVMLVVGLIATLGNGDNADEREYETGDGEGSADSAADISGGHSDIDSPADPVPASNMTIAGPTWHLPANKSFLEGVRAHG